MITHLKRILLAALFSPSLLAQTGTESLQGVVQDAETGEPLPSSIVRILNTTRGTVCNTEGAFRLELLPGDSVIMASLIGYTPDTLLLTRKGTGPVVISLKPADIILPEVLITGEDPAYAIIRRAIANKKRWIDQLHSYEMEAFTRRVLRSDTSIASIMEALTIGYWRQGDTLREITTQRRQTENIEASFNLASVGRLLNFYEEEIRFVGYRFVGPIADDAFDHYDYELIQTRGSTLDEFYEIRIIPLSATVPRFRGTVVIAGGSYALVGVDVEPNEAFLLPFVKEKELRYRQQFSQFQKMFWLPADVRIDGRFSVGVPGFSLPEIGFSQTSVIREYRINVPLPDSIFQKPRLVIDSTASVYDTTAWESPEVLPLTSEEQEAYASLDSTQTLDKQFRPRGLAMTLAGDGDGESLLRFLDLEYNRIEGLHLGGRFDTEDLIDRLVLRGGLAYGFSDKTTKYHVGLTGYLTENKILSLGGDYYNVLSVIPEQGYYGKEFNSLTSVLVRNDYRDYYLNEGWGVFLAFEPKRWLRLKASVFREEHHTAVVNTDFGLFSGSPPFRDNPPATKGELKGWRLDISLGRKPVPLDIVSRNNLDVSLESTGDFLRVHGVGTLMITTMGNRFLSPAGFRIRVAGGWSDAALPRQRLFSLESASSGYGPFGVMRAMRVKEFFGTKYISLNIEHNFRSLPFLAMDIPFLYQNNIEFVVHGGIAQSNGASHYPCAGRCPLESPGTGGWYSELGFGISRIFEVVRCDFTWRLSSPQIFHFTLGVANVL